MKTSLLIILVGFFVSVFWIGWLGFNTGGKVMVDGITVSAVVVTAVTVIFSIVSWFLFSWAFRNINLKGILLSVIIGTVLVTPFSGVLGPISGVFVGIVAGFVSCMIQKKLINPAENKSLVIVAITLVITYAVLITIILIFQTNYLSNPWDTGDGIGAWTGTPEGLESP